MREGRVAPGASACRLPAGERGGLAGHHAGAIRLRPPRGPGAVPPPDHAARPAGQVPQPRGACHRGPSRARACSVPRASAQPPPVGARRGVSTHVPFTVLPWVVFPLSGIGGFGGGARAWVVPAPRPPRLSAGCGAVPHWPLGGPLASRPPQAFSVEDRGEPLQGLRVTQRSPLYLPPTYGVWSRGWPVCPRTSVTETGGQGLPWRPELARAGRPRACQGPKDPWGEQGCGNPLPVSHAGPGRAHSSTARPRCRALAAGSTAVGSRGRPVTQAVLVLCVWRGGGEERRPRKALWGGFW